MHGIGSTVLLNSASVINECYAAAIVIGMFALTHLVWRQHSIGFFYKCGLRFRAIYKKYSCKYHYFHL